mgnify:CR=1 FL=1
MNPGEVWRFEDGTYRVVLSNSTYNTSALNRVITAVVADPQQGFDPFAVTIDPPLGPDLQAYADRLAMHPRHWLVERVGHVGAGPLAEIRRHVSFLLCE